MLVDTSVWVDHLRRSNSALVQQLERDEVWTHPFIAGELACGNLARRDHFLSALQAMPVVPVAEDDEVMTLIEGLRLMGRGLGYLDMHLLASASLSGLALWTLDKRLAKVATELKIGAPPQKATRTGYLPRFGRRTRIPIYRSPSRELSH